MVILSDDEISGGQNLRGDWPLNAPAFLQSITRGDGNRFLLGAMEEHCSQILTANVHALAVRLRWVVVLPKDLDQIIVGDTVRVISHTHGFDVAGGAGADLLVGCLGNMATGVTRFGTQNAIYSTVGGFDSPESASGKSGLSAGLLGRIRCILAHVLCLRGGRRTAHGIPRTAGQGQQRQDQDTQMQSHACL